MNVVSFGGGINSTAMIIGMYEQGMPIDLILFSDTGCEQPHTYEFVGIFNTWLTEHGLPEITTVFYTNKDGERVTLEEECLRVPCLPSIAYGFKRCSLKYKIGPQDKHCNNSTDCKAMWAAGNKVNKYIGYDAGEARRVEHALVTADNNKKYSYKYPLYVWGWNRAECIRMIERTGLPVPGKSSCFFCPSMKKREIQALWEQYPALFQRAIDLERTAAKTLTSVKGLGRKWAWESCFNSYMEAQERQDAQLTLFDFVDSTGGCICGAPCGCYDG